MLHKWILALPTVRSFKAHDKVCYLHFREEEIISTYDHRINGEIYQLDRGRPRLNPEAVPSENIPTKEELEAILKPTLRKGKKSETLPKDEILVQMETERITEYCEDVNIVREDSVNTNEYLDEKDENPGEMECPDLDSVYNTFYDNIHKIALPNTLWGVHRCPKRSLIFFTFLEIDELKCTKMVRLSCDGSLKVYAGNLLIYELSLLDYIHTLSMLSEFLIQIDAMDISEIDNETSEYQVLLE